MNDACIFLIVNPYWQCLCMCISFQRRRRQLRRISSTHSTNAAPLMPLYRKRVQLHNASLFSCYSLRLLQQRGFPNVAAMIVSISPSSRPRPAAKGALFLLTTRKAFPQIPQGCASLNKPSNQEPALCGNCRNTVLAVTLCKQVSSVHRKV